MKYEIDPDTGFPKVTDGHYWLVGQWFHPMMGDMITVKLMKKPERNPDTGNWFQCRFSKKFKPECLDEQESYWSTIVYFVRHGERYAEETDEDMYKRFLVGEAKKIVHKNQEKLRLSKLVAIADKYDGEYPPKSLNNKNQKI